MPMKKINVKVDGKTIKLKGNQQVVLDTIRENYGVTGNELTKVYSEVCGWAWQRTVARVRELVQMGLVEKRGERLFLTLSGTAYFDKLTEASRGYEEERQERKTTRLQKLRSKYGKRNRRFEVEDCMSL